MKELNWTFGVSNGLAASALDTTPNKNDGVLWGFSKGDYLQIFKGKINTQV